MIRQIVPLALVLVFVFYSAPARAGGQVIIQESVRSSGGVGGRIEIGNSGADVRIRVRPRTETTRSTTITTRGNVNLYTHYPFYPGLPPCQPPCIMGKCYPPNHPCFGCNQYRRIPCPDTE